MKNRFGDPEAWEKFGRGCDDLVFKAFPDATFLEKYGAGICFYEDGRVSVKLRGEERLVIEKNNDYAAPHVGPSGGIHSAEDFQPAAAAPPRTRIGRLGMDLVSDTPRTDAIAERFGVGPLDQNDAVEQYNDLLDLARQLERERSELLRFAQAAAMYGEGAALQDMATALLEKLGEPLFADLDAAPQECPPKGDEGAADKVHPPAVAAPYQPNYRCANCLVVSAQWLSCQKADCPHRNVGLTIAR